MKNIVDINKISDKYSRSIVNVTTRNLSNVFQFVSKIPENVNIQ